MKIEVIFSESPSLTQFAKLMQSVGQIWPKAAVTEPTHDLHIHIDCHDERQKA